MEHRKGYILLFLLPLIFCCFFVHQDKKESDLSDITSLPCCCCTEVAWEQLFFCLQSAEWLTVCY